MKNKRHEQQMFKNLALILLSSILFISFTACTVEEKPQNKSGLSFEQIGYYKGENRLRYFTFYVESANPLDSQLISKDILDELEKHGASQMNTSGQITVSFYYIYKNSAPNVTNLSAEKANDLAHERKPIASVWIMPSGQVNLIERPD